MLVLRQLDWLPVRHRHRVDFKFNLAVLVYKALYMVSHRRTYISDDCLLVAEVGRRLRLSDARTCVVYRGPGPSLVTGVLLWLLRGSGIVYRLHYVTLTAFTTIH